MEPFECCICKKKFTPNDDANFKRDHKCMGCSQICCDDCIQWDEDENDCRCKNCHSCWVWS